MDTHCRNKVVSLKFLWLISRFWQDTKLIGALLVWNMMHILGASKKWYHFNMLLRVHPLNIPENLHSKLAGKKQQSKTWIRNHKFAFTTSKPKVDKYSTVIKHLMNFCMPFDIFICMSLFSISGDLLEMYFGSCTVLEFKNINKDCSFSLFTLQCLCF